MNDNINLYNQTFKITMYQIFESIIFHIFIILSYIIMSAYLSSTILSCPQDAS